jgi:hypothetical protein
LRVAVPLQRALADRAGENVEQFAIQVQLRHRSGRCAPEGTPAGSRRRHG